MWWGFSPFGAGRSLGGLFAIPFLLILGYFFFWYIVAVFLAIVAVTWACEHIRLSLSRKSRR